MDIHRQQPHGATSELYSPDELAKFAASTGSIIRPIELETPEGDPRTPASSNTAQISPFMPPNSHELEAKDKATIEMQQQHYYALARDHARSQISLTSANQDGSSSATTTPLLDQTQLRPPQPLPQRPRTLSPEQQQRRVPAAVSMCETEFEDDDGASIYSAQEVPVGAIAAGSGSAVQVRNSILSLLDMYTYDGEVC